MLSNECYEKTKAGYDSQTPFFNKKKKKERSQWLSKLPQVPQ